MKISQKQIEAVIILSGAKRYEYFIKFVAESMEVWGLYQNGWALAGTSTNENVFPVWPAREYAELCAKNEWSGYEAVAFSIDDFMNDLLPNLKDDAVLPGVFYTPMDTGVTPTIDQILNDLNMELAKY